MLQFVKRRYLVLGGVLVSFVLYISSSSFVSVLLWLLSVTSLWYVYGNSLTTTEHNRNSGLTLSLNRRPKRSSLSSNFSLASPVSNNHVDPSKVGKRNLEIGCSPVWEAANHNSNDITSGHDGFAQSEPNCKGPFIGEVPAGYAKEKFQVNSRRFPATQVANSVVQPLRHRDSYSTGIGRHCTLKLSTGRKEISVTPPTTKINASRMSPPPKGTPLQRRYPTYQPQYVGIGIFPSVHFNKLTIPSLTQKNTHMIRSPVTVKVASPDVLRNTCSRWNITQSPKQQDTGEKTSNPCDPKTVIAALKEKRKRNLGDEAEPGKVTNKRQRRDSDSSTGSAFTPRKLALASSTGVPFLIPSSGHLTTSPAHQRTSSTKRSITPDISQDFNSATKRYRNNPILSSYSSSQRISQKLSLDTRSQSQKRTLENSPLVLDSKVSKRDPSSSNSPESLQTTNSGAERPEDAEHNHCLESIRKKEQSDDITCLPASHGGHSILAGKSKLSHRNVPVYNSLVSPLSSVAVLPSHLSTLEEHERDKRIEEKRLHRLLSSVQDVLRKETATMPVATAPDVKSNEPSNSPLAILTPVSTVTTTHSLASSCVDSLESYLLVGADGPTAESRETNVVPPCSSDTVTVEQRNAESPQEAAFTPADQDASVKSPKPSKTTDVVLTKLSPPLPTAEPAGRVSTELPVPSVSPIIVPVSSELDRKQNTIFPTQVTDSVNTSHQLQPLLNPETPKRVQSISGINFPLSTKLCTTHQNSDTPTALPSESLLTPEALPVSVEQNTTLSGLFPPAVSLQNSASSATTFAMSSTPSVVVTTVGTASSPSLPINIFGVPSTTTGFSIAPEVTMQSSPIESSVSAKPKLISGFGVSSFSSPPSVQIPATDRVVGGFPFSLSKPSVSHTTTSTISSVSTPSINFTFGNSLKAMPSAAVTQPFQFGASTTTNVPATTLTGHSIGTTTSSGCLFNVPQSSVQSFGSSIMFGTSETNPFKNTVPSTSAASPWGPSTSGSTAIPAQPVNIFNTSVNNVDTIAVTTAAVLPPVPLRGQDGSSSNQNLFAATSTERTRTTAQQSVSFGLPPVGSSSTFNVTSQPQNAFSSSSMPVGTTGQLPTAFRFGSPLVNSLGPSGASSIFGSGPATQNPFGSGGQNPNPFGTLATRSSSPSTGTQPPLFGSNNTVPVPFGSQSSTVFGAQNTSMTGSFAASMQPSKLGVFTTSQNQTVFNSTPSLQQIAFNPSQRNTGSIFGTGSSHPEFGVTSSTSSSGSFQPAGSIFTMGNTSNTPAVPFQFGATSSNAIAATNFGVATPSQPSGTLDFGLTQKNIFGSGSAFGSPAGMPNSSLFSIGSGSRTERRNAPSRRRIIKK